MDPKNVFGYILGEHGSHCFMPWSLVGVAGQPIDFYCQQNGFEKIEHAELLESVKQAGFEIFNRKNNTTHGIAASVFRIIQAISIDEHSVLPVGTLIQGEYGVSEVVLSLPTIINRNGVEKVLHHPFSDGEIAELNRVATALKQQIATVAEKTGLQR